MTGASTALTDRNAASTGSPPSEAERARFLDALRFDARGLVAVVAQQHDTGEVLMLAWMNREAVDETLRTGRVTYFSRSRNALWRKGETSGQVQHLRELRLDCDGDAVLALVDQPGVACHTGRRSCFSWALRDGAVAAVAPVLEDPAALYGQPHDQGRDRPNDPAAAPRPGL